jgi:TolB protein
MDEGRPADPTTGSVPEGAPAWPTIDYAPPDPGDNLPLDDVPFEPRGPSRGIVAVVLVLIAALVVFAFLGGRVVLSNPEPAAPGEQLLAVTDADGKLFTMDRAGGSVVEHSLPGIQFGFPGWSPDGAQIAVTGEDGSDIRLYVFDAESGPDAEPRIVYDESGRPPFYIYWSPDGRQIAFLTTEPNGIALRVVPANGSAEARIVKEGAPLYWDWLGSDHLVAHIGDRGVGSFLGEVDLEGSSTEQVPLDAGSFRSPAVSRDGSHRAYVTSGQDSTGIVTLESIDRSDRHVAPVFGTAAVSFDPTGSTLAYVAAEQPRAEDPGFPLGPLRAIDPATGETRTLFGGTVVAFFWSPDGRTIAALSIAQPNDEFVGGTGARLASTRNSPPGDVGAPPPAAGVPLTLAFVDVASGTVRSSHGVAITSRFVNNILPYYDQYALSHRLWARDSSAIALPLDAEGEDQLFVIPADGSEMTPLGGADLGFWSP